MGLITTTSCPNVIEPLLLKHLKELSISSLKEICGYIKLVNGKWIFEQKTNIHPDPIHYFLISPHESIYSNVTLFHSHPKTAESDGFSEWDLESQKYHCLDMFLYCVKNDRFYYKKS